MNSAYSLSVVQQTALVLVPELILLVTAIVMMTASAFVDAAAAVLVLDAARVRSWRRSWRSSAWDERTPISTPRSP